MTPEQRDWILESLKPNYHQMMTDEYGDVDGWIYMKDIRLALNTLTAEDAFVFEDRTIPMNKEQSEYFRTHIAEDEWVEWRAILYPPRDKGACPVEQVVHVKWINEPPLTADDERLTPEQRENRELIVEYILHPYLHKASAEHLAEKIVEALAAEDKENK